MPRYVVQIDPYGKFAVVVLDVDGKMVHTSSLHETRSEAVARAKYLDTMTEKLSEVEPKGPNPNTPSALRGYR